MERIGRRTFFSLLPAIALVGFVLLYPAVMTIVWSFFQWEGFDIVGFAGIENYVKIFKDSAFLNIKNLLSIPEHPPPYGALIHSILWSVLFVPITMFLGLLLATLTKGIRGERTIKAMILVSMVVPMVVGGVIVHFALSKDAGIINGLLRVIGLEEYTRTWTLHPDTALLSLIFGSIWIFTGLSMLIYSAGLETIPQDIEEAAALDGASRWKIFWHLTFPLLKPTHITAIVMLLIWSFKVFDLVYAATLGGPGQASTVMGMLLFTKAFYAYEVGEGLAIAAILTAIAVSIPALLTRRGSV